MTDAVTRLQRERDLALRRIDELHAHHKKEIEKRDAADRQTTEIMKNVRESMIPLGKLATLKVCCYMSV